MTVMQWPRLRYTPDPGFNIIKDLRAKQRMWDNEREPVMTFSAALELLKQGLAVQREGWNGRYLEVQVPDDQSKMSLPYIYTVSAGGDLVPWLASQTDLLADDWQMVELEDDA